MPEDIFSPMAISAAGLAAQRERMEAIARNLANAETTRSDDGEVYRRKQVVFTSHDSSARAPETARAAAHTVSLARTSPMHLTGNEVRRRAESSPPAVEAKTVVEENAGYRLVHDPHHPDADENGLVRMPDINGLSEMVDMMAATRAYEANLAAMKAYQNIVAKSLEI